MADNDQLWAGSAEAPQQSLAEGRIGATGEPLAEPSTENGSVTASFVATPTEQERLRAELEEKEHQFKRALADYDNYRRRTERDFATLARAGQKALIQDLLEVVDNFDRALATPRDTATAESLWAGMEAVRGQLLRVLEKYGAVPFDSVGKLVDPQCHEVMTVVPTTAHPPDTVVSEVRRGYRLAEELLRPAQVLASKPAAEETEAPPAAKAAP